MEGQVKIRMVGGDTWKFYKRGFCYAVADIKGIDLWLPSLPSSFHKTTTHGKYQNIKDQQEAREHIGKAYDDIAQAKAAWDCYREALIALERWKSK